MPRDSVFGPNTNGLKCTLATGIAGSLPSARKWHPALMLTYQRRRRHGPRSRVGPPRRQLSWKVSSTGSPMVSRYKMTVWS